MKKNNKKLEKIANFYNTRFNEYGPSIESTGWGTKKSQKLRFKTLFRSLKLNDKKILDVA